MLSAFLFLNSSEVVGLKFGSTPTSDTAEDVEVQHGGREGEVGIAAVGEEDWEGEQ
jgi:hypothetical protein